MIGLKVYTADKAGFCFGVKRALNFALKTANDKELQPVYTLGPIIHNPQVVKRLEENGVIAINNINEIDKGTIIIRSHGVSPDILKKASKKGLHIVDTTCPFVKRAQENACLLVKEGYQTFIYGDHNHPEVIGIYGATDKKAIIINEISELAQYKLSNKLGFVAQTTKSPSSYRKIIASIINKTLELKVFNTICNTTDNRQKSAAALAKRVDLMLVIGGYNSANTRRLAEICKHNGTPTYHIETAGDINKQWYKGKETIGISAGASTPEWVIKEVIEAMSEEKKELQMNEEINEERMEEKNDISAEEKNDVNENKENIVEDNSNKAEEQSAENDKTTEKLEEQSNLQQEKQEKEKEIPAGEEYGENHENKGNDKEQSAEIKTPVETDEKEDISSTPIEDFDENEKEEIDYSVNDIANLKKGQIVTGTVSQIKEDGVYVDVNYKTDGFIPLRELSQKDINEPGDVVELNEEIEVVILTLEDEEGNMILSKKRADYEKAWERIMDVFENDKVIKAEVTKVVKGGLVVDVGLRGFIPASHVAIGFVENLEDYIGNTIPLKVIEVERDRNNVVLSAKKVLEKKKEKEKEETLSSLEEGQVLKGKITKLVDFGAFVDLGGIEGLLHISEMSWGRIAHPKDVFEEGQEVEVKVLGVNKEKERVSLGYKQLLPDPWEEFNKKHYEGEIIEGKVTKLVDFGVFVEIENGLEGLIHISQLSHRHVKTPDEVVSAGEKIKVKIINIDEEQKRIGLSIKELEEKPEPRPKPKIQKENSKEEEAPGVTIRDLVGDIGDLFDKEEDDDE